MVSIWHTPPPPFVSNRQHLLDPLPPLRRLTLYVDSPLSSGPDITLLEIAHFLHFCFVVATYELSQKS